mgnify:CR=1 FL=1
MNANDKSMQTKMIELMKRLNSLTLEYRKLCEKFELTKSTETNPNAEVYQKLNEQFIKNNKEIKKIVSLLDELANEDK